MYQCEHDDRKRNPRENANVLSLITFFFTRHIFRMGLKKDLEEKDIYDAVHNCQAEKLGDRFEAEWTNQCTKQHPSLIKAFFKVFGLEYFIIGLNQLVMKTVLMVGQPLLIGMLVSFFVPGQTAITLFEAYVYGFSLIGLFFLRVTYMHNCYLYIQLLGIKMRVACCSLIYRKCLKLSQTSIVDMTSGKIVTLISKDVYAFDAAIMFGNDMWIGVLQVTVMSYVMYRAIGVAALVGVGFMIVIVPLQVCLGKAIAKQRMKCASKTDERLRLIQEVLTTMKIIKMYTWERFYAQKTNEERRAEIKKLRLIFYIKSIILTIGNLSTRVSFYICVVVYIYLENNITAAKAFTVISCYSTLRSVLTISIPIGISQMAEAKTSLKRIKAMLTEPDLEEQNEEQHYGAVPSSITITGAVAALNSKKTIFKRIDLEIAQGLVALTGPLGGGKSSLLKTILKDLRLIEGDIKISGNVSYASQEPWLFPGTVKQNVLFGQPFDARRYQKVVQLCALRSDIESFENHDQTMVIDKGLNLSKGQQARVNLARAIYKDADIYLLDDCLSSLDTNVSRFIFNNCIKEFLKGKLCVLVTHQQQYLKEADEVVYLKDELVQMQGTFDELMRTNFREEVLQAVIDFDHEKVETHERYEEKDAEHEDETSKLMVGAAKGAYHENKKEGKVNLEMYKIYLKSGGGAFLISLIIILYILAQISGSYFDYFVTHWIETEEKLTNLTLSNLTNTTEYEEVSAAKNKTFLYYTVLISSTVVFNLVKSLVFFYYTSSASIALHRETFNKMMKATMEFFDLHLTGNILNRFSKDIGLIDEHLPYMYYEVLRMSFVLIGVMTIIVTVNKYFLVYSAVLLAIFITLRVYYLPASRSLKRLDSATRAPLVGHVNASLEGLTTIRASRAQDILIKQFDRHQDLQSSTSYMYMTASRAFGYYLDLLCIFYLAAIVVTFLTVSLDSYAGKVGLAITQAFGLSGLLQWGIRQSAELENSMTSVERIVEYSRVKSESDKGFEPSKWPSEGRIEFLNVSLKYPSVASPVLENLNLVVEPRQKIGVIGRTGAGKSSIISTLFRLYDVAGTILVDKYDIKTLKLSALRTSLSIIPQDPVLFSGSLRSNLDPYDEHSDETLWRALEAVALKGLVEELTCDIIEGGSNFSVGQRQLICLARALIRKNKILILDEATANVDPQTDALLQMTIREKFAECTVLTIAHRLDTVMDSDKIMVLDKGKLLEFDSPKNLLNNEKSRFYNMAKQAGLVKH